MRLIDADALNVAEEVGAVCKRMGLPEKSIFEAFVTGWLEGAIDGSPTIDAVPVVRGEWIRMDETQALLSVDWKCSLCEQEIRVDGILTAIGAGWNFCPNCGADNRGSEVT